MNQTSQILQSILSPVNFQINIPDVIIGVCLAILVPVMYYNFQKYRKRQNVRKFWETRKEAVEALSTVQPINSTKEELKKMIFELRRMELFVAESFSEDDFLTYAKKIRALQDHADSNGSISDLLIRIKTELENLVSLY